MSSNEPPKRRRSCLKSRGGASASADVTINSPATGEIPRRRVSFSHKNQVRNTEELLQYQANDNEVLFEEENGNDYDTSMSWTVGGDRNASNLNTSRWEMDLTELHLHDNQEGANGNDMSMCTTYGGDVSHVVNVDGQERVLNTTRSQMEFTQIHHQDHRNASTSESDMSMCSTFVDKCNSSSRVRQGRDRLNITRPEMELTQIQTNDQHKYAKSMGNNMSMCSTIVENPNSSATGGGHKGEHNLNATRSEFTEMEFTQLYTDDNQTLGKNADYNMSMCTTFTGKPNGSLECNRKGKNDLNATRSETDFTHIHSNDRQMGANDSDIPLRTKLAETFGSSVVDDFRERPDLTYNQSQMDFTYILPSNHLTEATGSDMSLCTTYVGKSDSSTVNRCRNRPDLTLTRCEMELTQCNPNDSQQQLRENDMSIDVGVEKTNEYQQKTSNLPEFDMSVTHIHPHSQMQMSNVTFTVESGHSLTDMLNEDLIRTNVTPFQEKECSMENLNASDMSLTTTFLDGSEDGQAGVKTSRSIMDFTCMQASGTNFAFDNVSSCPMDSANIQADHASSKSANPLSSSLHSKTSTNSKPYNLRKKSGLVVAPAENVEELFCQTKRKNSSTQPNEFVKPAPVQVKGKRKPFGSQPIPVPTISQFGKFGLAKTPKKMFPKEILSSRSRVGVPEGTVCLAPPPIPKTTSAQSPVSSIHIIEDNTNTSRQNQSEQVTSKENSLTKQPEMSVTCKKLPKAKVVAIPEQSNGHSFVKPLKEHVEYVRDQKDIRHNLLEMVEEPEDLSMHSRSLEDCPDFSPRNPEALENVVFDGESLAILKEPELIVSPIPSPKEALFVAAEPQNASRNESDVDSDEEKSPDGSMSLFESEDDARLIPDSFVGKPIPQNIQQHIAEIKSLSGLKKIKKLDTLGDELSKLDEDTFMCALSELVGFVHPDFIEERKLERQLQQLPPCVPGVYPSSPLLNFAKKYPDAENLLKSF